MKRILIVLIAALSLVGCTSTNSIDGSATSGKAAFFQSAGPLVAQIAQTRIAFSLLERNPGQVGALEAIAAALDVIAEGTSGTEITDTLIRGWVTSNAGKWGLLPGEDELLVQGLLAARSALLSQTNLPSIHVGDWQLKPWIDAVRFGIRSGVAAHKAKRT